MLPFKRPLAYALMLGIGLTACASPALPGVRVRAVGTDLGLGLLDVQNAAAGPASLPELPDFVPRPPFQFDPPEPVAFCPTADFLEFPEPTTPSVRGGAGLDEYPLPGDYRWVHDLTVIDPERANQLLGRDDLEEGTFRTYGEREVRGKVRDGGEQLSENFTDPANDATGQNATVARGSYQFTEDMRPGLLPNARTFSRSDIYRVQPFSYADNNEPQETNADAGESVVAILTGWNEYNEDAEDANDFSSWLMVYSPPPILLQFPVSIGQRVRWVTGGQPVNALLATLIPSGSSLPDPSRITPEELAAAGASAFGPRYTFDYDGMVTSTTVVDACGDPLAAWLIEGTLTIGVDGDLFKIGYDYAVATQFGGLIVYERFTAPAPERVERLKDPPTDLNERVEAAYVLEAFIGSITPK